MNFFVIRCGVLWTDAPPACLVRCHGLLSRSRQNNHRHLKQTTTITIITIALINCNALSVGILTLDSIISLAASSPHPLVHLTLGQLFGRLNRWQKKSTNPQKQFCDSPERNFCRPVAASSWCEEGLKFLKEMVVVPNLTWPGDGDSPIPGTGGGDLR